MTAKILKFKPRVTVEAPPPPPETPLLTPEDAVSVLREMFSDEEISLFIQELGETTEWEDDSDED